jgi:hypothetical protein
MMVGISFPQKNVQSFAGSVSRSSRVDFYSPTTCDTERRGKVVNTSASYSGSLFSNLGPANGYGFSWLFSVHPGEYRHGILN